jgi:hypothetical protein
LAFKLIGSVELLAIPSSSLLEVVGIAELIAESVEIRYHFGVSQQGWATSPDPSHRADIVFSRPSCPLVGPVRVAFSGLFTRQKGLGTVTDWSWFRQSAPSI